MGAVAQRERDRLASLGVKVCASCGREKDLADFSNDRNRRDGLQPYCRGCQSVRARRSRQRHPRTISDDVRRQQQECRDWIREARTRPCEDCGETLPQEIMQFHHVDPSTKIAGVVSLTGRNSLDRVKAEAAKCVVICPNCHALRHLKMRGGD